MPLLPLSRIAWRRRLPAGAVGFDAISRDMLSLSASTQSNSRQTLTERAITPMRAKPPKRFRQCDFGLAILRMMRHFTDALLPRDADSPHGSGIYVLYVVE